MDQNQQTVIKEKFKALDENHDGLLSFAELCNLLRKGHDDISDAECTALFKGADADGSGKVSFNEFVDFVFAPVEMTEEQQAITRIKTQASEMIKEVTCVQIYGAYCCPELNDTYDIGDLANGKNCFERGYPKTSLFYGWTEGRKLVGWFIGRQPPGKGPVMRYKMFSPSPTAERPDLCAATWQTAAGLRDKTMFVEAIPRDRVDDTEAGECNEDELCDRCDDVEDEHEQGWDMDAKGEAEDQDWDAEWNEDIGEGVADVDQEDGFDYSGKDDDDGEAREKLPPFTDDVFPATDTSLGESGLLGTNGWKRAAEMHETPLLFKHVSPDDVVAFDAPDFRWFSGACAAVAEYPSWIQSMFGTTARTTEDGKYTVRLYHPGKKAFMRVTVDDFIPTKDGSPSFAGITMNGEIWVALLEKALAKLCGSYKNMQHGSIAYGMLYLCGGGGAESWRRASVNSWGRHYTVWEGKANETICRDKAEGVKDGAAERNHDKIWMLLRTYMEKCYPVACHVDETKEQTCGLAKETSYSLIGARQVHLQGNKMLRIVCLRNPFSSSEWNGRWSDNSDAWQRCPAAKEQLRFNPSRDGTFWMAFSDFVRYFQGFDVVKKAMPVQGCHNVKLVGMKRGAGVARTERM